MFFNFVKHRKIFYTISSVLVVASIVSIVVFGLNLGIDFTGGSILKIQYQNEAPLASDVKIKLVEIGLEDATVQITGDQEVILKMQNIEEEQRVATIEALGSLGTIEEGTESFESIGPVIGQELQSKTKIVIILSLLAVLIYIAMSFRRVARPVRSYIYGITGVIALFHDVIITLGVFVVLGHFYGVEINIPIITAFLTVFGYSINDSVVIFDRVRENLLQLRTPSFDLAIDTSLNQSLKRSLHTSITTLIALFAIFFLGGESLRFFSLALIIGILAGTYSSLFLATPLLATYLKLKERKYHEK